MNKTVQKIQAIYNRVVLTVKNWITIYGQNGSILVGVVAVIAAIQISMAYSVTAGVWACAAGFAALIGLALWHEPAREIAIAAAIWPVSRMVSLTWPQGNAFSQTLVLYGTLLLLGLVYRYLFSLDYPVKSTKLSARGYLFALPLMLVLGQICGVIGFGLFKGNHIFSGVDTSLVGVTVVVFALAEEVLFRGLIQQRAQQLFNPATAAVFTALLYTLAFVGQPSWTAFAFAALLGIITSAVYYYKQNLILTVVVNAMAKVSFVALMAAFIVR